PAQAERPQAPNNGGANTTNRGAIPPMNGVNRGGNPNMDRGNNGNPNMDRGNNGNPNMDRGNNGNSNVGRGNNPDVNRPNVPRPGAPQGAGSQGEIHQNGRGVWVGNGSNSRGEQNSPANHPNAPDNARDNNAPDNARDNNAPVSRPNAPDMNRPPADNNR